MWGGGGVKVSDRETVAQIRAQAQQWYERHVDICSRSLGTAWPALEDWVKAYLKEELREHLIARGWRPKHGR